MNKSKTTHTPLPWSVGGLKYNAYIINAKGRIIADCENCCTAPERREQVIANTEHIVMCVNSHGALVDALRYIAEYTRHQSSMSNNTYNHSCNVNAQIEKIAEAALKQAGHKQIFYGGSKGGELE